MIDRTEILPTLQSIPWFFDLSPEQMSLLGKISGLRRLETNEILFHEGDNENLLYIISEGRLAVDSYVPKHGIVRMYTAEQLDVIGWSSMTPVVRQRVTTVYALQPSCLIYFDATTLQEYCEEDPQLGYIFMRRLSNVIASRLLSTRIQLFDLLAKSS